MALCRSFQLLSLMLEESFGEPTMLRLSVKASDKCNGVSVVVFNSQGRASQAVVYLLGAVQLKCTSRAYTCFLWLPEFVCPIDLGHLGSKG